jgi:hypothetical protein
VNATFEPSRRSVTTMLALGLPLIPQPATGALSANESPKV